MVLPSCCPESLKFMSTFIKWLSITLVLVLVSMSGLLFFAPAPPLMGNVGFSRAVFDDHKRLVRLTLSNDAKYRLKTPLSDMPYALKKATLLQEDQYFYSHPGINPVALIKAVWQTYVFKTRRIGASTITMQVARMQYDINSKTIAGKMWQVLRAFQLEAHYSKAEILEAYLNLAPYGNNIEGIGAASYIYFGKPARELSLPEILTLVVIPQNPTKRVQDGNLQHIRNKLYARWIKQYPQDKNQKSLMNLPLQMHSIHQVPFLAPHFANKILEATSDNQIQTTLNLSLQKTVTHITKRYLERKAYLGVNNAAVLIVDSRDMNVKVMLGSADFFNRKISGQINGTEIKRSPGSTLKPFIYGLAIDQGLIHPGTVLKDVPHSFGNYNPENFDNDFAGPIKAKDALILSRNIPAVYLADQLRHPSLYEFLQQANVTDLKSESYYGLALVLGGAEISMAELVSMYAMLANDGIWKPLLLTNEKNKILDKRLLSKEASFLVLDMLKDTQPPENVNVGSKQMATAWKTGTSSGFRDAWTVGVFDPYVMAVWIGNFDNHNNPAFIGKDIAAPLFFEIENAIQNQFGPLPVLNKFPERMHLTKVDVCKASGMLPTRYCKDTEPVWFIPGKSPIKTDTIYREIAIDSKTGLRACKFDQSTKFEIYEFWSSDLLKIFKRAGIARRIPPVYDPSCENKSNIQNGFSPQIISPKPAVNYVARFSSNNLIIPLTAVVDADVSNVHWFVNETYLGKIPREQSYFWKAKPGHYIVRVVDDYGRSDVRDVNVELG